MFYFRSPKRLLSASTSVSRCSDGIGKRKKREAKRLISNVLGVTAARSLKWSKFCSKIIGVIKEVELLNLGNYLHRSERDRERFGSPRRESTWSGHKSITQFEFSALYYYYSNRSHWPPHVTAFASESNAKPRKCVCAPSVRGPPSVSAEPCETFCRII